MKNIAKTHHVMEKHMSTEMAWPWCRGGDCDSSKQGDLGAIV